MLRADKLKELMDIRCDGNYNRFVRELEVDASHLHPYLKSGVGGGRKLVESVYRYCKKHGLDYEEYVDV